MLGCSSSVGAWRTSEHLRFRWSALQIYLWMCICNCNTTSLQQLSENSIQSYQNHGVAFSGRREYEVHYKVVYMYTIEDYSAIRMKEILTLVTT